MKTLNVKAAIENVPVVTEFVDEILESVDCSMKAQTQIDVVIDEIFSNIAFYAYGEEGGDALIEVEAKEGSVKLVFSDTGKPYNPLEAEEPDITASVEDRKIGGLGIFMVKKMMDEVSYVYEEGHNRLTLVKNWE